MNDRGNSGEKLEFAGRPRWKFAYKYHINYVRKKTQNFRKKKPLKRNEYKVQSSMSD